MTRLPFYLSPVMMENALSLLLNNLPVKYSRVDPHRGLMYFWHGGRGIHVFHLLKSEYVDFFNVGEQTPATEEEVKQAIDERIAYGVSTGEDACPHGYPYSRMCPTCIKRAWMADAKIRSNT